MPNQDASARNGHKRGAATSAPNTLPVTIEPTRIRHSLSRHTIPAHFLSQLIAEKNRMAVQRPKRRAPTSLANEAYRAGRRVTIRHMPAGYGLTEIA